MSALSDLLGAGLTELENVSGGDVAAGKVTYNVSTSGSGGTAYACVASTLNKGNQLEAGGMVFTTQFTLHIRVSVLGAVVPQTGKLALYNSVIYRVGNVRLMQGYYAVDLDSPDK